MPPREFSRREEVANSWDRRRVEAKGLPTARWLSSITEEGSLDSRERASSP